MVGSSVLVSLGSVFYPLFKFLLPPAQSEQHSDTVAAEATELKPGSAKVFRFGNRPALLIRDKDGSYRAVSAVCSHLNCTVQYLEREQVIWCACHNGTFDLQGRVVSGPPPKPLEAFAARVRGKDVVVTREKAG
jgi:Rieske Fe-S protein